MVVTDSLPVPEADRSAGIQIGPLSPPSNWLMNSYLYASRQMMGSSEFCNREGHRGNLHVIGLKRDDPPEVLIFSFCPSAPTIFGILGPWISMSQIPTCQPSAQD